MVVSDPPWCVDLTAAQVLKLYREHKKDVTPVHPVRVSH